eukprot:COSAG02_NODE_24393_length_689_cov_2.610169_1_plen_54_part_10
MSDNQCYPQVSRTVSTFCYDITSSANFIFGLSPGLPERFESHPFSMGGARLIYQ